MSLIIENLTKTYSNKVKALDNLSLKIGKGMFGLLGPNGAGKSTLMRTIATLQSPDTGSIKFNDINVIEDQISLRKTLGYLPQSFGVYPNMSADELLNYFAKLKGISDKNERKALIEKPEGYVERPPRPPRSNDRGRDNRGRDNRNRR